MNVGDIVRLKSEHHLSEFIKGGCFITQIVKYSYKHRKTRYHIKTIQSNDNETYKPSMTWVHLEELDLVSDLRNQKLKSIGI